MTTIIREAINCDYEWIQYNNQLRVIRSIKDDMYQMQSIINACNSNKLAYHYFENQSTKDVLDEFELEKSTLGIPRFAKSWENRKNLPNGLRGYYVHRYLVNDVAIWASRKYHLRILKLLDEIASNEREELTKTIAIKEQVIAEQAQSIEHKDQVIESQRPRMVPEKKEKCYCYMIWKEDVDDPEQVLLHLVKRNRKTFGVVSKHFKNDDERWFYRDNLPISMTLNEKIKELIPNVIPEYDYDLDGSTLLTYKMYLPKLHEAISEYFDQFQS